MIVLTLETTCDETAAAVVTDKLNVLGSVVASQEDLHRRFGGVVPEIASRAHVERILPVIDQTLRKADLQLSDLNAVAVATTPGLAGSLLVGLMAAKTIALALKIPLISVDHLQAHIYACRMAAAKDVFPCVGLVVSGGHTSLYDCHSPTDFTLLGSTIDEAAGEAFDKVASMLGLPYPGGPVIDALASRNDDGGIVFPRPMLKKANCDFSFSGMKTAVMNYLQRLDQPPSEQQIGNIAAAFQTAVVDVVIKKTLRAAEEEGLDRLVIAGGVACNSGLRRQFADIASKKGLAVHFPSPILCADNAAMLAVAGDYYLSKGLNSGPDLNAVSSWSLEQAANF